MFRHKTQLKRHISTCPICATPSSNSLTRDVLTKLIMDTTLKPLLEVANTILQEFKLHNEFRIEEWVYFQSEGIFRTEGHYVGDGPHVIRIGKIHTPDHYMLLDTSIVQTTPPQSFLHDRPTGQPFFNGIIRLTSPFDTSMVAQIIDKGQYPWGDNHADCQALQAICDALHITTSSGVRNCCTYTHIMYAILNTSSTQASHITKQIGSKEISHDVDSDTELSPPELDCIPPQPKGPITHQTDHHQHQTQSDQPSPLTGISSLYRDYEYPEMLDTDSEWFPFDTKADAIIYMWDAPCKSNRLPNERLTLLLQALPLIGVEDLTCNTAQAFRDKYDSRLPLMDLQSVSALKNIKQHRKANKGKTKNGKSNQTNTEATESYDLKVQVPFFCPDEFVIRTMADPIWSQTLRFGLDKVTSSEAITQFNQTPYAAEILRWSQLQSIDRIMPNGQCLPIMVGYWYTLDRVINGTTTTTTALVQKLLYQGGDINRDDASSDDWWPVLFAEVRTSYL